VLGFTAMVALLNSLLGVLQSLALRLIAWRRQPVQPPLFIIGHWRSGTTILHQLMALDPQFTYPSNYVCFCPHHFLLTEWLLADGFESIAPPTRMIDELPFDAATPQEDEFALLGLGAPSPYRALAFPASGLDMAQELRRFSSDSRRQTLWKRKVAWFIRGLSWRERKRIVLKSPPHTLRVQSLLELYPNAQFVWISRDRGATVASTVAMWKKLCQTQSFCVLDDSCLASTVARSVDVFANETAGLHDRLKPNQFYHLRFEALLANPVAEMQKLYTALQIGRFRYSQPPMLRLLQSIKAHKPTFPSPATTRQSAENTGQPVSRQNGARISNRAESCDKPCISEWSPQSPVAR
jgi:hypothetical protein